jgi:hypothetical protein
MLVMTVWSLGLTIQQYLGRILSHKAVTVHHLEGLVALVLVVMSLWLVVEALLLARRPVEPKVTPEPQLV